MKYLSLVISLALTAFIFSMSQESGEQSASLSETIALNIQNLWGQIFPAVEISFDVLHYVVRKAAHFGEFFLLGVSYSVTFRYFHLPIWSILMAGTLVAFLDELSQFLPQGRGPSFLDVLFFDLPGYFLGVLLTVGLIKKISHKLNVS